MKAKTLSQNQKQQSKNAYGDYWKSVKLQVMFKIFVHTDLGSSKWRAIKNKKLILSTGHSQASKENQIKIILKNIENTETTK